ncbi:MAG: S8 family serine peptidase [Armatimonadota bacterium]
MWNNKAFSVAMGVVLGLGVSLRSALAAVPDGLKAVQGEIVVRVPDGVSGSAVDRFVADAGCEVIRPVAFAPGYYLVGVKGRPINVSPIAPTEATQAAIVRLRAAGAVSADPNLIAKLFQSAGSGSRVVPNDPLFNRQWDKEMIRMPEAFNIQTSNRLVRVGVVDSGIQADHPDFRLPGGGSRVAIQGDFVTGEPSDGDTGGHGTHVSGIIAATANNGVGVAGVAGWNRGGVNIQLVSARVFGAGGSSTLDIILSGTKWMRDQNVQVANFSLGFGPAPLALLPQSFTDAVNELQSRGIVVVAAAGNDGVENSTDLAVLPGDIEGVIKVTSVGPDKKLSVFSNYGGNPKRIAAPGGSGGGGKDDILSTYPTALNATGYATESGTSMACPQVAGAAALMIAAGARPAEVYPALAKGAQVAADGVNIDKYGPGVLDVYSSLLPFSNPDPTVFLPGSSVGNTGVGSVDYGTTYFQRIPVNIQLMGVGKIVNSGAVAPEVNVSDITVEIQTMGRTSTALRTYVGGRDGSGDFDVPQLRSGDVKSTVFTVAVPRAGVDATFGPGQYRISAKVAGVEKAVGFINIVSKRLPKGRSMFASPFRADLISGASPESGLLGSGVSFGLARYNPLRLSSQDDYARFRSNGSLNDPAARFTLGGSLIAYDIADPTVSIAPVGVGFWLDLDRETVVDTSRLPEAVGSFNPGIVTNPVAIKLFANGGGWNMIGAPYLFPVNWGNVTVVVDGVNYSLDEAIRNGVIMSAVVGYRDGDYVYGIAPQGLLEPFNAYWVRVYRDCTLIIPPSASSTTRSTSLSNSTDGWRVRFGAIAGGDRDANNVFGVGRNAADVVDRVDVPKPPAGGGHAYLRFLSDGSNGSTRSLAYDIKSSGRSRKEWTAAVSVDSADTEVRLVWDGLGNLPKDTKLTLVDVVSGSKVSMGAASGYTFRSGEAGSSRLFRIVADRSGSRGAVAVTNVRLSGRGASGYSVAFTTNTDAEIFGTVTTLTGKIVARMAGDGRAEGLRESVLRWDGKGSEGGSVPAGPYRINVQARTADGDTASVQRIIQVIR